MALNFMHQVLEPAMGGPEMTQQGVVACEQSHWVPCFCSQIEAWSFWSLRVTGNKQRAQMLLQASAPHGIVIGRSLWDWGVASPNLQGTHVSICRDKRGRGRFCQDNLIGVPPREFTKGTCGRLLIMCKRLQCPSNYWAASTTSQADGFVSVRHIAHHGSSLIRIWTFYLNSLVCHHCVVCNGRRVRLEWMVQIAFFVFWSTTTTMIDIAVCFHHNRKVRLWLTYWRPASKATILLLWLDTTDRKPNQIR